eukprot:TRINITY_DN25127_c0_g1_i1.p1 TRINITY_DN25127_c0_g1~~TRINITY_DN25127_c0_g1_i1.p1  ORF type:complete len:196 (-),score=28.02 TRINITY_DN25127_c0_g1_i1:63-650(-)
MKLLSQDNWFISGYIGICSASIAIFLLALLVNFLSVTNSSLYFFFGFLGVVLALTGGAIGSAYGIAKSSLGVLDAGVSQPEGVIKNLIPIVMAGMLGIYGLIISVFIVSTVSQTTYTDFKSFAHLWSGGVVGLSCIPVGVCTGVLGEVSTAVTKEADFGSPKSQQLFVSMVLLQVFAGACGLYALIVGLLFAVQN